MPRRKAFDAEKSVKFRLVYRSSDDPNAQEKTLSDMVFQPLEPPKSKLEKVNVEARDKILNQFTKEDFGIIDEQDKKKVEKQKIKQYDGVKSDVKKNWKRRPMDYSFKSNEKS